MQAYNKKIQIRKAREQSLDSMLALTEHFDLLWLWTLHSSDITKHGAKRLRNMYREFVFMYDDFKRRYMAADDSTVYGDRTDTYALKKRLKEIGFDFDLECELIQKELELRKK